ncbi:putative GPI anchored protein [Aspergillus alliaceus]|uniref:putative GPI anchored protein n=1 Tax=Petromyces alliaceus TaxID=209559 RepID=UPI0012A56515|nr:uncharacterized protein BDW43DRAFT_264796 [Aspergillus alliaceus]KAB8237173.1 hypothetical protein BDW43DRAFT_264796 [Aspergillus alliaceus]
MLLVKTLSILLATATFCAAQGSEESVEAVRAPIPARKDFTPIEEAGLERRATCADGGQCLFGQCCGGGCAPICCAHDNGGLGCNLSERCQFKGNVFVGCCNGFIGRCTGEATRVTVHSPADSTMFNTQTATSTDNDETTTTSTTRSTRTRTSAESTATVTSDDDHSSGSSPSSTSSNGYRRTSATETGSTTRSSPSAKDSVGSSSTGTSTASRATSGQSGDETGSANAAPAITALARLEMGAVAVGALLVF